MDQQKRRLCSCFAAGVDQQKRRPCGGVPCRPALARGPSGTAFAVLPNHLRTSAPCVAANPKRRSASACLPALPATPSNSQPLPAIPSHSQQFPATPSPPTPPAGSLPG
eukprot:351538-Chlamydomonas_euryale.AAC.4